MRPCMEEADSSDRRHHAGRLMRLMSAFVTVFLVTATVAWPAGADEGMPEEAPSGLSRPPIDVGEGASEDTPDDLSGPPTDADVGLPDDSSGGFSGSPTDAEDSSGDPSGPRTDAEQGSPEEALSNLLSLNSGLMAEVSNNRAYQSLGEVTEGDFGEVKVRGEHAELSVPPRSKDAISVSLVNGTTIGLGIPGSDQRSRLGDDSVIYDDIMQGTSAIVQPQLDGGFRVVLTIDGPESPKEFAFPIEGNGLNRMSLPDGGVLVVDGQQKGIQFESPWAYDARGTPVPASFSLVNGAIVLRIQPSADTVYPIVADPWGRIYGWFKNSLKFAGKFVHRLSTPMQVAWDIADGRISKTWPRYLAGWAAGTLTFLVCGAGAAGIGIAVFGLGAAAAPAAISACAALGYIVNVAVAQVVDTS